MDDFKLDGRNWNFLNYPEDYIPEGYDKEAKHNELKVEPLKRQFETAKEILSRIQGGHGVLLADDVGLGKTTIGALVAWVVACQGLRVRIYAPNAVLQRRWAEELERHILMLRCIGASSDRIKQGSVGQLRAGKIQVTTHHALQASHNADEQRAGCDLMIIDEAHRAKGDGSAFKEALNRLGGNAKRKLILTATPFSIRLEELKSLLGFVGATQFEAVETYANDLERLYTLCDGHDAETEAKRLVDAAKKAIDELQPNLIRHGADDLTKEEKKHLGVISQSSWAIQTRSASDDEIELLLRMDRILQLTPGRANQRRNDPRFHIGWQQVDTQLQAAECLASASEDAVLVEHINAAKRSLKKITEKVHPKMAAVCDAIGPVIEQGEKVLVFCHHHATARELLSVLEGKLKIQLPSANVPSKDVWREAWEQTLQPLDDHLLPPIIDFLCSAGIRAQVSGWIGKPASSVEDLAKQFKEKRARHSDKGPKIDEAASSLATSLLGKEQKSTRSVLRNIGNSTYVSNFPGELDEGYRAMGAWDSKGDEKSPLTLYTGQPDIVLSIFNSPFGPDVLVTTDRLSEGVDLHRCCRHLIHYELDPSPVRTIQRNGRIRRFGSWAALTEQPICYAYPMFRGTRDEKATEIMRRRIDAFGMLLGGVPSIESDPSETGQGFADDVLKHAGEELAECNGKLCVSLSHAPR